jgi:hypothetical protein
MTVHLHIERLVLDGLPLEAADGPAVQAAVEAELTRLLSEEGVGPGLQRGGALASLRGTDVELPSAPDPGTVGREIGGAVHRSLRR